MSGTGGAGHYRDLEATKPPNRPRHPPEKAVYLDLAYGVALF